MSARLVRTQGDRMIGGVCAGLGCHFGIDPLLIRLAFVLLTLHGGAGPLIYLLLLFLMPVEASIAQER